MTDSEKKAEKPLVLRGERGRFLPGFANNNPKGRPKGSGGMPHFASSVRAVAESQGVTLDEAVQAVTEATIKKALDGDTAAQRLILERVPDSKVGGASSGVAGGPYAVDLDGSGFPCIIGTDTSKGPQVPSELAAYLNELAAIEDQHPVPGIDTEREPTSAERVHYAELERQRQIDELLS